MNPDKSGFISRKLVQIEWSALGPHPRPFSQGEKGDKNLQMHLAESSMSLPLKGWAEFITTLRVGQFGVFATFDAKRL